MMNKPVFVKSFAITNDAFLFFLSWMCSISDIEDYICILEKEITEYKVIIKAIEDILLGLEVSNTSVLNNSIVRAVLSLKETKDAYDKFILFNSNTFPIT